MPATWDANTWSSSVGMIAPVMWVRVDASARPAALGIQFSVRAASRALLRRPTPCRDRCTRETVAVDTPASFATSPSTERPLPRRARRAAAEEGVLIGGSRPPARRHVQWSKVPSFISVRRGRACISRCL
jgi:hypothetical protein